MRARSTRDYARRLDIEGELLTLEYDWSAFEALEAETGISILGVGIGPSDMSSLKRFRAILRAGLLRHHPDLPPDTLGRLLRPHLFQKLHDVVRDALHAACSGGEDVGPEENPPLAQRSPGTSSGPSVELTSA